MQFSFSEKNELVFECASYIKCQ